MGRHPLPFLQHRRPIRSLRRRTRRWPGGQVTMATSSNASHRRTKSRDSAEDDLQAAIRHRSSEGGQKSLTEADMMARRRRTGGSGRVRFQRVFPASLPRPRNCLNANAAPAPGDARVRPTTPRRLIRQLSPARLLDDGTKTERVRPRATSSAAFWTARAPSPLKTAGSTKPSPRPSTCVPALGPKLPRVRRSSSPVPSRPIATGPKGNLP